MNITIKRAYAEVGRADGYRVLVDRLWPRGVKKELLALNEWNKDVAPSRELRTWFGHDPVKFDEFRARYEAELNASDAAAKLLKRAAEHETLTLVFAAKDQQHNHAIVLRTHLNKLRNNTKKKAVGAACVGVGDCLGQT